MTPTGYQQVVSVHSARFHLIAGFSSIAVACALSVACGGHTPSAEAAINVGAPVDSGLEASTPSGSAVRRLAAAKRMTWRITFQGAEMLHPGMTLREAVIALDGDLYTHDTSLQCSYFRAARAPGMRFLFLNRRLARIEVDGRGIATTEGVKIGATEKQVRDAYPGRVTVTKDQYTDHFYLAVAPPADADTSMRLVFVTNGKQVVRYRTGVTPAVEWDEGCS